jgi:hypothetical protein
VLYMAACQEGQWPLLLRWNTFLSIKARFRLPFDFTCDMLHGAELPGMDLWLVGAALCMAEVQPWATLQVQHVYSSQGWACLRNWSLDYARGVRDHRGEGTAMAGRRRRLRFECVRAVVKGVACQRVLFPGPLGRDVGLWREWVEELAEGAPERDASSRGAAGRANQGGAQGVGVGNCRACPRRQ